MTTLAEQVAGLKIGYWVEARFQEGFETHIVTAQFRKDDHGDFMVSNWTIESASGEFSEYLTSITPVPRPIPQEPEVGSFALGDKKEIYRRSKFADLSDWYELTNLSVSGPEYSWPEIYPHIVRLYTPSGELVTDFEYAEQVGEM